MKFDRVKNELEIQENLQGQSRNTRVRISGSPSESTDIFLERASEVLHHLKDSVEGRENQIAIQSLAEELDMHAASLEEAYYDGLRYNVKAALKLGLLHESSSNLDIESVVGGFTLNFRKTLRFFVGEIRSGKEVSKNLIISAAKRGYVVSPELIEELREKYADNPDAGNQMIYKGVASQVNPEEFIEGNIKKITELKEFYREDSLINDWLIKQAVLNHKNPSEVIEKWLTNIRELKQEYHDIPWVDDGMLRNVVLYNKNPKEKMVDIEKKFTSLSEKYQGNPDIDSSTLKRLVLAHKDPESAIEVFLGELDDLSQKFSDNPDASRSFIKIIILGYSASEKVIESKLAEIKRLREKYADNPDAENWMLRLLVSEYINPEKRLISALQSISDMRLKYGDKVPDSEIKYAAVQTTDPDAYLSKMIVN